MIDISDLLPIVSLIVWVPLFIIWAFRFKYIMKNGYGFKTVGAAITVQGLAALCIAGSILRLVTHDPYARDLIGMSINVLSGVIFAGYTYHRQPDEKDNKKLKQRMGFGGVQIKKKEE